MNRDVKDMRQDYNRSELLESNAAADPFDQFDLWFHEAKDGGIVEPNAMTIATASKAGVPSARLVLMKEYSRDGVVFYTNYDSHKGHDLAENPKASLLFYWELLQRQVRIEGTVEKVPADQSDAYFGVRPIGSRIGAIASPQSTVIDGREALEEKVVELQAKYTEEDAVPRPANWGGYLVKPTYFEFWQGRSSRLHDRLAYELVDGVWQRVRLAP